MKTEWICRWQYIPGREKHLESYPTLDAARMAMAKVLRDGVDLKEYLQLLRNEDGEDCGSAVDFLEKFLADLVIPKSEEEIPPHIEIPDHCRLQIHPTEGFRWDYMRGECPSFCVSHVYYGNDGYPFIVDFAYENPVEITPNRVNSVRIQIDEHIDYGKSAYPLMVWNALTEEPQTCEQLIDSIWQQYNTVIERKAVGRHLKLLENLGFPLLHNLEGYYRSGEFREHRTDVEYRPGAYPLMIALVLDGTPKTQAAIIQSVQEKFGTKIGRKAVSRHMELLKALHFQVQ